MSTVHLDRAFGNATARSDNNHIQMFQSTSTVLE